MLLAVLFSVIGFVLSLHSNLLGDTKGSRRFRVIPEDAKQIEYLQKTYETDVADFWTYPRYIGNPVDFTTIEWMFPVMKNKLNKAEISFEVIDDDLEVSIEKHLEDVKKSKGQEMNWFSYYTYEEITDWLKKMSSDHKKLVTVKTYGKSFEGRDLMVMKISSGAENKSGIWINGGFHGREWISPAATTFVINEILQNWDANEKLFSAFEFYFVPIVNPDSYAYSWTDVRLWSKTRSDAKLKSLCIGVNPDRNWNVNGNENEKKLNPCSDNYPGPKPFSEVEMKALSEEILHHSKNIKLLLNIQAYGQKWFSACSFSCNFTETCEQMDILGEKIASASSSNGIRYEYVDGLSTSCKYSMLGTSVDWARQVGKIPFAYVVQLPDNGTSGFLLEPGKIQTTGKEMTAAFKEMLIYLNKEVIKEQKLKDEL